MKISILGIPYKIIETEQTFEVGGINFGEVDYKKCEILINKNMTPEMKKQTLCHEIMHVIFLHLGMNDLCNDEQLVQALGMAINNVFDTKETIWQDHLKK